MGKACGVPLGFISGCFGCVCVVSVTHSGDGVNARSAAGCNDVLKVSQGHQGKMGFKGLNVIFFLFGLTFKSGIKF